MLVSANVPASRACITAFMEGLTVLDMVLIERRGLPSLYELGIRYRPEPRGQEKWLNADEMQHRRFADCEDLACYLAAQRRLEGIPALAVAIRTGRKRFHGVVRYPDGTIEDPSRKLGMKG